MYNADLLVAGAVADAGSVPGGRTGASDVDGLSAPKPVPHRRHPRDVHARGLHARHRGDDHHVVRERPERHGDIRRRVRHQGDRVSDGADRRHARGAAAVAEASIPPTSAWSRASPSCRSRPIRRVPRGARRTTSCAASTGPSSRTRPTGSRPGRRGSARIAQVWSALEARRGLAVSTRWWCSAGATSTSAGHQKFQLRGFYLEDKSFTPVPVDVRDPQTGRHVRLTVIGVLSDTAPLEMAGISTSQRTLAGTFGDRVKPTVYLFSLRPGVDADATATRSRVGVPRQRHAGRRALQAAGRRGRRARSPSTG